MCLTKLTHITGILCMPLLHQKAGSANKGQCLAAAFSGRVYISLIGLSQFGLGVLIQSIYTNNHTCAQYFKLNVIFFPIGMGARLCLFLDVHV